MSAGRSRPADLVTVEALRVKLNHLNLTVPDVTETRKFLEKYFGLQGSVNPYTGESIAGGEGRGGFAVLFDDAGLVLTLMKGKASDINYPATFHIGFMQESEEKVNELNRRLKDDGFAVGPPQRSHAWTFYVRAPGGFVVEVLC
jgi:catechol 2,3-dioxygenase-like lactoylglutathione lyase family enzyme